MTDKPIDFDNQARFTFTFWLKRKEGVPTGNPHLIVPISTHWVLWTPGKGIGFFVPEISTEPLADVWTHYAVVFDRASGKYQLFVNGNPELADIPATKDAPGSKQWVIGQIHRGFGAKAETIIISFLIGVEGLEQFGG
jgi:hypothetical protein